MNLSHIKSFYETVKCNSISKAAKELHLTQPGLSMQLQTFENEIGEKLLNRSNKGVSLTEEGKIVFEFVESMIALQNNLDKKLKNLKDNKSKLYVSTCNSLGEQIIPCSIYTFKEIHPNINISMDIDNSKNILKKLLNHDTNIAIIHEFDNTPDNVVINKIMSDKLILVGSTDSEINSLTLDELVNIPIILREEGSGTLSILKRSLANNNILLDNLNVLLSLNSSEAIKSSVISGRGFAFMPELSITHELKRGTLKKINIKDFNTSFNYNIVMRKNYDLSDTENKFLSFITSNKRCFCY